MAEKLVFKLNKDNEYEEIIINFEYIKGMAFSQKQKNVLSLHKTINKQFPELKVLEISTKSNEKLGIELSAFNLKLDGYTVECIFQSSKVFEGNVQFLEILKMNSREGKKYISLKEKGLLIKFRYKNIDYPLIPTTAFYDYIFILALKNNIHLSSQLLKYDIFTDIEFNYKKSLNCQARACAIFVSLYKKGKLDYYLSSFDNFIEIYQSVFCDSQMKLF